MELEINVKELSEEQLNTLINLAVEAKVRERMNGKRINVSKIDTNNKTVIHRRRHKRGEDFTIDDIKQIWKLYQEGNDVRKIGRIVGRTYYSIHTLIWAIKNKVKGRSQLLSKFITEMDDNTKYNTRRYKHLTNTEKATIIKELKAGNTLDKVANLVNRSRSSIYYVYEKYKKGKIKLDSLGV